MAKFLNLNGLTTLLNQLKQNFATEAEVGNVIIDTVTYVTNIDYSLLQFDTSEIVSGSASSPILDVGLLDQIILA